MIRKKYDANFKAKIALEAIKENMTISRAIKQIFYCPNANKGLEGRIISPG